MSEPPLLEARGLTRRLGDRLAIDGVELTLREGERLGVVGASGAGKSTLARLLSGDLSPTSGSVRVRGRILGPPMRRRVQLVLQDPGAALDPRLTADAALAPVDPDPARRRDRLAEMGLPEAVLSRRPDELSGGQKQRLVLARALAVGPEVLVLDEPTSALDEASARTVVELLDRFRVAQVWITHDLALVTERVERVLVLAAGRVVESGPPRQLWAHPAHPATRALVAAARALGLPLVPE